MTTYAYDRESKTFGTATISKTASENAKSTYTAYGFEALLNRVAERNNVALAIVSAPGCGKTAIVEHFCEINNRPCVKLVASTLDESDIAGILALKKDEQSCTWFAPDFVKILGENGVLFLDELNCARKSVLDTLLNLIQSRELPNSHIKLGEGVMIVACMNPADMCDNTELSPAMKSRFMWVEHTVSFSQYVARMTGNSRGRQVKLASSSYLTYKEWEKRFISDPDFEKDKKAMLIAADNLGLNFTNSEDIPESEMISNARSMSMLLYFCKSAKEVATWSPAFLDKTASDILKSIEVTSKNDVSNAVFNKRAGESVNEEEDNLLRDRSDILNTIQEVVDKA